MRAKNIILILTLSLLPGYELFAKANPYRPPIQESFSEVNNQAFQDLPEPRLEQLEQLEQQLEQQNAKTISNMWIYLSYGALIALVTPDLLKKTASTLKKQNYAFMRRAGSFIEKNEITLNIVITLAGVSSVRKLLNVKSRRDYSGAVEE